MASLVAFRLESEGFRTPHSAGIGWDFPCQLAGIGLAFSLQVMHLPTFSGLVI